MNGLCIGVDIGGTFTDAVAYDRSKHSFTFLKLRSSARPDDSVFEAISAVSSSHPHIEVIFHSTTIATNALITRKGWPNVAMITTEGFRDVLEIGRQRRQDLYNLRVEKPRPIVPRSRRYTVSERVDSSGAVIMPVRRNEMLNVAKSILKEDIDIVCVSFINSYINAANEHLARQMLEAEIGLPVICSADVDPLPKEYERFSTTAVNALLQPIVAAYLGRLGHRLSEISGKCPLYIMQSDGGATTVGAAMERPISIIESGPASGVVSALALGRLTGRRNLLTFDMGGTTAKAGIIRNGNIEFSREFEAAGRTHSGRSIRGSGYPVRFPFIDLAETSSGGGSIAWIDAGGSLKVGPGSAGSIPGPVCYGFGGTSPTITDACLVLGRLGENTLLSGEMHIDRTVAFRAIEESIAKPLSISTVDAALWITALANDQMARIMRIVSVERGLDPRMYEIVAFGGAGPLHAAEIAMSLGVDSIIIPAAPGLFSAYGLIAADLKREYQRSVMKPIQEIEDTDVNEMFGGLEENARLDIERDDINGGNVSFLRTVSLQYSGQGFTITIPASYKGVNGLHGSGRQITLQLASLFHRRHKQIYGYSSARDPVIAVSFNLTSVVTMPRPVTSKAKMKTAKISGEAFKEDREVVFTHGTKISHVYDRKRLSFGNMIEGPAVIEQYDSTTLLPVEWTGHVDCFGNIVARRRRK